MVFQKNRHPRARNDDATQCLQAIIKAGRFPCRIDWSAVRMALAQGADPNVKETTGLWAGSSALHDAAVDDRADVIDDLVTAGVDINMLDRGGWSALMKAASLGRLNAMRALLRHGATINASTHDTRPPMRLAIIGGHLGVIDCLVTAGDDVNAPQDQYGLTPLMEAAAYGQANVARTLLRHGADIHTRNDRGKTALAYAIDSQENVEAACVLIEAGASLDRVESTGLSFLEACDRVERRRFLDAFDAALAHPENATIRQVVLASAIPDQKARLLPRCVDVERAVSTTHDWARSGGLAKPKIG